MDSCAITGPRPSRFKFKYNESAKECVALKSRIKNQLIQLYRQGIRNFYAGGALGVDMWCSELLLSLQKEGYADIHLITAIPFKGYDHDWKPEYKERMIKILERSDIVVVCQKPGASSYLERNRYMVDHADCLLAVYDIENPISRSGTAMTIRYAQKIGLPTIFIQPSN